jgi:hypothetical protein
VIADSAATQVKAARNARSSRGRRPKVGLTLYRLLGAKDAASLKSLLFG